MSKWLCYNLVMRQLINKYTRFIKSPSILALIVGVIAGGVIVGGAVMVSAESFPGGTDNGKTSRIKQLNDELTTLGHGSPSNTPDWGANWNRINTSAKWTPDGDTGPSDVRQGKKFYNGSRIEQTGTKLMTGPCPTQGWHDSSSSKADSCVSDWPVAAPAVSGDDKKDPVTGLVWSKCLQNTAGVNDFSTNTSCANYSWDGSASNNNARTAIQLCSDRGNGWRLPVQKELMQAYIDGSNFNLMTTAANHWSATEVSVTYAWYVNLSNGFTNANTKTNSNYVRCVR